MCGIVGIVDRQSSSAERTAIAQGMSATLVHRGPDADGLTAAGPCTLGLRRLAIVDVESPSCSFSNETETISSVANAEIYNAPDLRRELLGRGHSLHTAVDTEVLPHLWEDLGPGLVPRLDGMFALAIWDSRCETLLLARDRAGEKPLFYWQGEDGALVFASELRAVLAHPRVGKAVDPVSLRRYLVHDFFPAPATPFAEISKLPAGHLLLAGPDGVEVERYWDLSTYFEDSDLARPEAGELAEELDVRIARAVARRRRADVSVGVFLSGGIDSTTVLAHLSDQVGPGVPVFALGHTDPSFDESRFARKTSRFFDAEFHPLVLGEEDLADGLRRVGKGFDEPLGDASTIPTHLLALHARSRVKVVLSGEGADEIFAGYPTYAGHRLAGWFRRLPRALRRGLLSILRRAPVTMSNVGPAYLLRRFAASAELDVIERHHRWFGSHDPVGSLQVLADPIADRLRDDDPLAAAKGRLSERDLPDELSRLLYTDFTMYLQDDLLTKVDRATMLASLEARAPFLDHELVEFAARLPSSLKLSGLRSKAILRRASRRRLPAGVLRRRKRGFNIPFSRWLLHGLGDELRERFARERVVARGLLDPAELGDLLDDHLEQRADHRKPLFNLLALDLWCDKIFGEGAEVPVAESKPDGSRKEPVTT